MRVNGVQRKNLKEFPKSVSMTFGSHILFPVRFYVEKDNNFWSGFYILQHDLNR